MGLDFAIFFAVIAIGVVVVGLLFGFVGLIVAVPILSLIVILTEELWVKPMEESRLGELDDRDHPRSEHADDDHDLHVDPEPGHILTE